MQEYALEQIIRTKIKKQGPITFATFMEMALYHPFLGYYTSQNPRIGPQGDFYTSPHLHPILGWMLAIQLDEIKSLLGHPNDFRVIEVGAGRGLLAEAVIAYIQQKLKWPPGWRYIIVERNPRSVGDQKKRLEKYEQLITWQTSLAELDRFCGCIISNEVVDAFPVHIIHHNTRFMEIYVGVDKNGFTELWGEFSTAALPDYISRYAIPAIKGYRTEVNLNINGFMRDVDRILAEGFIITIDYGYPAWEYYAEERRNGTLVCYQRHKISATPYIEVGQQDITAHVNFTSLKDLGQSLGMAPLGYCSQGAFLVSLGIDEVVSRELAHNPTFDRDLLKIKSLLFGMGDSHKVMIQYKGMRDVKSLQGFALKNRLNML